jgi:hypothetical protein
MAQDVPPYNRLPPDSQPWGRWVSDRLQSSEQAQNSALSNLQAQNKSLAAQLNRLQETLAEIGERRSYSVQSSIRLTTTTPFTYLNYSGSDKIDFTLARRSVVRVSGSASLNGTVLTGTPALAVEGGFGVYIDTLPPVFPNPDSSRLSAFSIINYNQGGLGGNSLASSTNLHFATTVTLDAGPHTVRPLPIATYAFFTGTSGTATLENIFFSVDVLGFA